MRIVAAIGGNAILRRSEPTEAAVQARKVEVAVRALAGLILQHEVVITHANGPRGGVIAVPGESYGRLNPQPLDVLGAESDGMVGFNLELGLRNALPDHSVATVLTEVVVDSRDRAFSRPGSVPFMPSPNPQRILPYDAIRTLLGAGATVICAGGGGIPVVETGGPGGRLRGVEAVIDNDLIAALLAEQLDAEMLLLLTDVAAVEGDWGTSAARPLGNIDPVRLRSFRFAPGSIGPKVEAACRFVERGGREAAIGAIGDAAAIVRGTVGTHVLHATDSAVATALVSR